MEEADICLLDFDDRMGSADLPVPSFASLSSVLKREGITTKIMALNKHSSLDDQDGKSNLVRILEAYNPKVVGLSVLCEGYMLRRKATKMIAQMDRRPNIVWGNVLPTAAPDLVFSHTPEIDYIVHGYGENAFLELVKALLNGNPTNNLNGVAYRNNGDVVVNPPHYVDFPSLPWADVDYRLGYLQSSRPDIKRSAGIPIEVARGNCNGACNFCTNPILRKYIPDRGPEKTFREPEDVFEEMQFFISNGYNGFSLMSSTEFSHPYFLSTLMDLIESASIHVVLSVVARTDEVVENKGLVQRLCTSQYIELDHFEIGIESDSDNALNLVRKGTTSEINREALKILLPYFRQDMPIPYVRIEGFRAAPRILGDFIMFTHPDMSFEDLQRNKAFAEEYATYFSCGVDHLRAFPKTDFWREMVARGYKPDPKKGFAILDYQFTDSRVQIEFEKYRRYFVDGIGF